MSFQIRLFQLMNVFNISNKKLALACNVDPSLVSRWRNGQRIPSLKSNQLQSIAQYFLNINPTIEQKHFLQEILSIQKLQTPKYIDPFDLMVHWLYQKQDTFDIPTPPTFLTPTSLRPINKTVIEDEDIETQKALQRPHFLLSEQTKRSYHVFKENSGKRKAALLFLQKALSLSEPTEIYIYSDEIVQWWLEDQMFQVQWTSYLKLIVLKNHHIHIIHHVNRNQEEFTTYLNIWIPLHLIGSISSYYIPQYIDNQLKETNMIIKDTLALVSNSTFLTPKENICFIYEDQEPVELYESLFLGRLVACKPLIEVFRAQDQFRLIQFLIDSVSSNFPATALHAHLNTFFLPDVIFENYSKTWPKSKQIQYLRLIKQYKSEQYRAFSKVSYVDVFPFEVLMEIASTKQYRHYDPVFFQETVIVLDREMLMLTLKNMVYALQRYERLNIFLIMKSSLKKGINLNLELREHHSIVFTTNYSLVSPYIGLHCNEGNMLNSFSHYLESVIMQIPSNLKNKIEAFRQLDRVLKQLDQ